MSVRAKRASAVRKEPEPEPGPSSKRRKTADPDDALWQLRPVSDLKMSSIYNRSASEAPAELFRKDLISAMKLPDSEPLTSSDYWTVIDTWKQDWERGVQVPVNPDSLPAPKVKIIENKLPPNFQEFKLPKDKYIHLNRDAAYQPDRHHLSGVVARAEASCTYDLDAADSSWLKLLNFERARAGVSPISEDTFEKVIEELEVRCWDKIQAIMKSEEGLGIEFDENVICDVCRSPDSEEGNEMVFCDSCNICVHQACYGITAIPSGQWLCRPCGDGVRPTCVLCPNLGGAMKCTPSGNKWAHVSCVLWIPEVSIGCPEKMEPITKISAIPQSRWSLLCVLCRERKGACIQCSVKTCKTAYHVTCAFKHGLEMRAIIEDENADDGVKLRSYCQKHSVNSKKEKEKEKEKEKDKDKDKEKGKEKEKGSGSEEDEVKRKRRKDMTSEEKSQARAARLQEIEAEFDCHVSMKDISTHILDVDQDAICYIYNYWKLKRRSGRNRPLLPPKSDETDLLTHRQGQADLDKLKMFVQLRQDLERVRNLCYMVSRREKLSRSFFRIREQTFHKQLWLLSSGAELSGPSRLAIIEANHGPSIYDRLYSHPDAPNHKSDFEIFIARIAGDVLDERRKDLNGIIKSSKNKDNNPYKKVYVNGSTRRSGSMYGSGLSSEESAPENNNTSSKYRNTAVGSSTDEERPSASTSHKGKSIPSKVTSHKITSKKIISSKITVNKFVKNKGKSIPNKVLRKKTTSPPRTVLDRNSSSDEDTVKDKEKETSPIRTLMEMEEALAMQSCSDSDDFMPKRPIRSNKCAVLDVYSDDSSDNNAHHKNKAYVKSPNNANDSQQHLPRTKAAMKEFIPMQKNEKSEIKTETVVKKRGRKPSTYKDEFRESDEEAKNKENITILKGKDYPSDFIVPQRQAAKKASENMRSTTSMKMKDNVETVYDKYTLSGDESKSKYKGKYKSKDSKETKEKESPKKKKSSGDSYELENIPETISYVPQRQAAKKAAAHIKSGLGNKPPTADTLEDNKKRDPEKSENTKVSPRKEEKPRDQSPSKSSTSSSSNSSSSSYSSSSSSEEEETKPEAKPCVKAREIKPAIRQPSLFSPQPSSRPTVDLPFLDKVSRPLSSTSASSDSDSSKGSRMSGSTSPSPRRTRRPRRKDRSSVSEISPRKAPDKKLKTSERRSECRVSSPTAQGEESIRHKEPRSAPRSRARSTASSGSLFNKSHSRPRKSSNDHFSISAGANKTFKQSGKSSEHSSSEWKANEALNKKSKEPSPKVDFGSSSSDKANTSKSQKYFLPIEEKHRVNEMKSKHSPQKNVDSKHSTFVPQRSSVKDGTTTLNVLHDTVKERKIGKYDLPVNPDSSKKNLSPTKIASANGKPFRTDNKIIPLEVNDSLIDHNKHWFPKAPSPNLQPPPVEKPGGNEKYMTEDKSFDSDYTEKTSIKMIAKIQATLNENTMIKSPKTPMDARTVDHIDVDTSLSRNIRKRSIKDVSHMPAIDVTKGSKIPTSANTFPTRSIFSPQPRDNELFELDMMAVDDGYNHDEIMKPFTSCPEFIFKEDSKEDRGVQETLNLVEKLRMTLSTKKPPASDNTGQEESLSIDVDSDIYPHEDSRTLHNDTEIEEQSKGSPIALDLVNKRSPEKELPTRTNNVDLTISETVAPIDKASEDQPTQNSNTEKWSTLPILLPESPAEMRHPMESKYILKDYRENIHYRDEHMKESTTLHTDMQSTSELDRDNISKQSDDSQSLSVVDHSVHSIDHESISQENQTNDNNNSLIHSDCATISSPYVEHSQDSKWRESKITQRRSSASSTNSEGSICSQKTDMKSHITINSCDSHQTNMMPELDQYPQIPQYPCPMQPLPLSQYNPYANEPTSFINAITNVPLFPPVVCASSQLPLPSARGPLYPASMVPYSSTSLMSSLPKPAFSALCSAAFTTSSQNIALTTAMIAPPTPKPVDSPHDDIDIGSDKYSLHPTPSPTISVDSYNDINMSRTIMTKVSNESSDSLTIVSLPESRSPAKLPKVASKLIDQRINPKSPGKSPGISPKQSESGKSSVSKRSATKSSRSHRGRGRSKSRHGIHTYPGASEDYLGNSIQSKLVGTVYDFDEEIANDSVDLKALRERRKSVDERKSENSYKESPSSPTVTSPSHQNNKRATPALEVKDPKPRSPSVEHRETATASSPTKPGFPPVVQPVLPGPVDMRTYQAFENTAAPGEPYHSHLLAFASGTADQQLIDIDEEMEKQLHSALMASKTEKSAASAAVSETSTTQKYVPEVPMPKVSLSDSRNQLKVKIKGPFLDANYSTSSVQPVPPQPPVPAMKPVTNILGTPSSVSSSMMTGTTNLRRMRKKELLRQYWTQDMNMDDPTNTSAMGPVPTPAAPPPLNRAVITIPKAVASMTSIPTREDYRGYSESNAEKKKRKNASGMPRDVRHLDTNDDNDPADDMRLSNYCSSTSLMYSHKRRGRVSTKPNRLPVPPLVTPKLKIKIGSNFVQPVPVEEPMVDHFRPPKKRLASLAKPSLEDLRRESMKYRKMVMADFEEDEKVKKHKPKAEKHKKKKDKKSQKLRVINSDSDSANKLIIKIKRTKDEGIDNTSSQQCEVRAAPVATAEPVDPFEYDPTAPDPLAIDPPSYAEASSTMRKIRTAKVTPIRLKLARNAEGSSYVMKETGAEGGVKSIQDSTSSAPTSTILLGTKKHSEFR